MMDCGNHDDRKFCSEFADAIYKVMSYSKQQQKHVDPTSPGVFTLHDLMLFIRPTETSTVYFKGLAFITMVGLHHGHDESQ